MPNYSLFDEIPQQMPMQPMSQMIQQFGAGTGLSDADRRMFMNQPSQMIQQFGSGSGLSDMDRHQMMIFQHQMMQREDLMRKLGLFDHLGDSINAPDK